MANGRSLYVQEMENPYFAASWHYPLGTKLTITKQSMAQMGRQDNQTTVEVTITDRGPAKRLVRQGRIIDLSQAAFQAVCGDTSKGLCKVTIQKISNEDLTS